MPEPQRKVQGGSPDDKKLTAGSFKLFGLTSMAGHNVVCGIPLADFYPLLWGSPEARPLSCSKCSTLGTLYRYCTVHGPKEELSSDSEKSRANVRRNGVASAELDTCPSDNCCERKICKEIRQLQARESVEAAAREASRPVRRWNEAVAIGHGRIRRFRVTQAFVD